MRFEDFGKYSSELMEHRRAYSAKTAQGQTPTSTRILANALA
jgi:hypothetical protein